MEVELKPQIKSKAMKIDENGESGDKIKEEINNEKETEAVDSIFDSVMNEAEEEKKNKELQNKKLQKMSNEEQIAHGIADIVCDKNRPTSTIEISRPEKLRKTSSQSVIPGPTNDSSRAPFKNVSLNSPKANKAQKKITSFYSKKEASQQQKKTQN